MVTIRGGNGFPETGRHSRSVGKLRGIINPINMYSLL
jgi:hypothetical protein